MFTRRWLLFALAVVVLAYGTWWLGAWQFRRLAETKATNAITVRNLHESPVPADQVLSVGRPVPAQDEWKRVIARGTYDPQGTVTIRYQTRNGASGIDVVTPLRTSAGPAILVDRGWVGTVNAGTTTQKTPPPPSGTVTVVGWVRADDTSGAAVVTDHSARSISSVQIGKVLPFPVYGGFLDALKETPAPAHPLVKAESPDLSNGPHLFYGIQWWFFGVLAVFGFFYLAWDEWRKKHHPERVRAKGPDSEQDAAPESVRS